jgi:hypothetical protein
VQCRALNATTLFEKKFSKEQEAGAPDFLPLKQPRATGSADESRAMTAIKYCHPMNNMPYCLSPSRSGQWIQTTTIDYPEEWWRMPVRHSLFIPFEC